MKGAFLIVLSLASAYAFPREQLVQGIKPRVEAKATDKYPKYMNRIVGGIEVNDTREVHNFPHAVAVLFNGGSFCSGQLIHENWVMTAGHCCNRVPAGTYDLRLGAHNWRNPDVNGVDPYATKATVKNVFQHEDYNGQVIINDICLLELTEAVKLVPGHIEPVVLATNKTTVDDTVGSLVFPCGWGKTFDGIFSPVSDVLMWTNDTTISDEECQKVYPIEYDAGEICIDVRTEGHGTCNGDSGGPLNSLNPAWIADPRNNYKWITQGITSYGSSAGCESGYPDAFTDVAFYNGATSAGKPGTTWIYKTTRGVVGEKN